MNIIHSKLTRGAAAALAGLALTAGAAAPASARANRAAMPPSSIPP